MTKWKMVSLEEKTKKKKLSDANVSIEKFYSQN